MMQLQYRNAITALKGEMIKIKNRLSEANTDLEMFSITVHDHDALLITLVTHKDILQMKMTRCNDKLRLHSEMHEWADVGLFG